MCQYSTFLGALKCFAIDFLVAVTIVVGLVLGLVLIAIYENKDKK